MTELLGLRHRTALLAGSAAALASRRFGRGGGTALPGLIATQIDPGITAQLIRHTGAGAVVVTGTNGKTTTTHLLAMIVRAAGLTTITNSSGSNLERGIVSAYLSQGLGKTNSSNTDTDERLGIFEVDEAALPRLMPALTPRVMVFLNLFRDQLDRYGEVDSVANGWEQMLATDVSNSALVLNVDDPAVAKLAGAANAEIVTFGIEDIGVALDGVEHAADALFCDCGAPFRYEALFVGHVGHWNCVVCGVERSRPLVAAHEIQVQQEGGITFVLEVAGERRSVQLPLQGLYSVYNALAAAATAHVLGIPLDVIVPALTIVTPPFGRQEQFQLNGCELQLWLAKNPAGMNVVLRALTSDTGIQKPLYLLMALNDDIQDGRDVSWIYDADFELLSGRPKSLVVTGDRADDLALRLHLAGVRVDLVQSHRASALDEALRRLPIGSRLDLIPTYTGMLQLRELIAGGVGAAPYWHSGTGEEV